MIWESYPWKEELLRIADRLERKTRQKRWTDRTDANLEKDVFVGCYAVRKLAEARKLSQEVLVTRIPCTTIPFIRGKRITLLNWHHLDELYDFERQAVGELTLTFLCNQFIHSYVFTHIVGEETGLLEAVAVSSDRKRRECLYVVNVSDLMTLFRKIGSDYPDNYRAVWDEKLGDYVATNFYSDPCDLSTPDGMDIGSIVRDSTAEPARDDEDA